MTTPLAGIGHKMAKGAAWMVFFKLLERSLGLISTVVLARLLVPADFGLIAMATVVLAVVELLGAFNFDIALIQRSDIGREYYDTAWTLNIFFAAAIAVFILLLAGPAAAFYKDPRVEHILYWLALASLLVGFENIGTVAFRKELAFRKEFGFLLSKKLFAVVTTVSLALIFRSYWALVAGMVTSRVLGVVLSYMVHSFRPKFSLVKARELLNFSKWLFVNNIVFVMAHRGPEFVLGRIAGPTALGLYTLSLEISNLPTSEIAAPINRAVLPGYAILSQSPDRFRTGFLTVISLIAIVGMPAAAGIFSVSTPLVEVMLGPKWIECGPIISILAFYGLISVLQTNCGYVFVAVGKPHIVTRLAMMHAILLLISVIPATYAWGAQGTASAVLFTATVMVPLAYRRVFAVLNIQLMDYVRILWRPTLAAVLMAGSVHIWFQFQKQFEPQYSTLSQLIGAVLIGAAIYILTIFVSWRLAGRPAGAELYVLNVVKNMILPQHQSKR